MATAIPTRAEPRAGGQHIVLHDVRWEVYEFLRSELSDHHIRLTYDRGAFEIM
jgi:hypothetical protein